MEELLKAAVSEAVKQVPALAVLSLIVWMFVKVILRFIKHVEDRGEKFNEMHAEHLDARNLSRQAIMDNTKTMHGNTEAIRRLSEVVEKIRI